MRDLRRQHPHAEVHTRHLEWNGVRTALLDCRVDAAVARLPFPTAQLYVTVLFQEPRVLVVPTFHRLTVFPYVAGDGTPLFADVANPRHLELVSGTALPTVCSHWCTADTADRNGSR